MPGAATPKGERELPKAMSCDLRLTRRSWPPRLGMVASAAPTRLTNRALRSQEPAAQDGKGASQGGGGKAKGGGKKGKGKGGKGGGGSGSFPLKKSPFKRR